MSAPSLSLFSPPAEPTLLETYGIQWEHLRGKATRGCDMEALRFFDRLHPNVPAFKLTFEHTRKARRELDERVKARKISRNQANKIARHLNRFLALLGPNDGSVDPEDPLALQPLGILAAPLHLAVPPKQTQRVEGWIELDEYSAFLAAAASAKWCNPVTRKPMTASRKRRPPQISCPAWWQAAFSLIYNTALRISEANEVAWTDRKRDRHGEWLAVREEVSKTGRLRWIYLNRHALAALDVLKVCGHGRILAWDYSLSFLDRCRREIFERAKLHRLLDQEIGWHGLRKLCATNLAKLGGVDIAGMHLGHAVKSVTAAHYLHDSAVIEHVDRLPQPEICQLPVVSDWRQLRLFE